MLKLRDAFSQMLGDLRDVMGAAAYAKIVPVPPAHGGDYMARKVNDEIR